MLDSEKQECVYKAIQDINKSYREEKITEKDPLLYVERIKKWLSLFYALDLSDAELRTYLSNIQKLRKKEDDADHR